MSILGSLLKRKRGMPALMCSLCSTILDIWRGSLLFGSLIFSNYQS